MSKFQIIITAVFAAFIVIGVILFSVSKGKSGPLSTDITIWGPMSSGNFEAYLRETPLERDKSVNITYIEKSEATSDRDLVEAIASGRGPDLFFLPQDSILKNRNKVVVISYDNYSARAFKDTFIDLAELYLGADGIYGLPFIVDPMILYWNKDIFSSEGVAKPPQFWNEVYSLIPVFTQKDERENILRSAISIGEFSNISNAKEILSALMIQAGTPIVVKTNLGYQSVLNAKFEDQSVAPGEEALRFFTDFSNPARDSYTWNRALPLSQTEFISGDLALYIGFASELSSIRAKNPNLTFDITSLPQLKGAKSQSTFGRMYALAIAKNSRSPGAALKVATVLSGTLSQAALVKYTGLPPVRRDLLSQKPKEANFSVYYTAALRSRAWLDPDRLETREIFGRLVESVTAGRDRLAQAILKANQELQLQFNKYK